MNSNSSTTEDDSDILLRTENVHKWFGEVHALDGIDFTLRSGEVVGLIGDNGAGKSTFIKIIAGLLEPDRGTIEFRGKPVNLTSVQQARELGIETVFQEQAIVDSLSIARNIFLGRERTTDTPFLSVMDDRSMQEQTEKLMERLNLDVASPTQEAQFCSGGERQGVAIARAMYFDAQVLILDEPTRALSVSGVEKVQEHVRRVKDAGTGVIYITHDLERVYPIADRFVFFSQGKKELDVEKSESNKDELHNLYRRE